MVRGDRNIKGASFISIWKLPIWWHGIFRQYGRRVIHVRGGENHDAKKWTEKCLVKRRSSRDVCRFREEALSLGPGTDDDRQHVWR